MEGRTIVRPDLNAVEAVVASRPPSMEGRTIVRPDSLSSPSGYHTQLALQWRAGQSSGQTMMVTGWLVASCRLQWRAGQSSGQTLRARSQHLTQHRLQWRAGQSSGQTRRGLNLSVPLIRTFNGGPDNRPARPTASQPKSAVTLILQWRAGQSSGQTIGLTATPERFDGLQWRAGQSSGQTVV